MLIVQDPEARAPWCRERDCHEQAEYRCDIERPGRDTQSSDPARAGLCNRRVCVFHAILAMHDFHICQSCYDLALAHHRKQQRPVNGTERMSA